MPHHAAPHQIVKGSQGFLERRVRIPAVNLVEVEVISLQALQAAFDTAHDVDPGRTRTVDVVAHGQSKFGGKHDLFADAF